MISSNLVHLGFVVNEVPSTKILHREFQVFLAIIIPPLYRTHSFTSHQNCLYLPKDSVIKQHTFKFYNTYYIIEWIVFFCSNFYHILPFQIGYHYYVYRYIHVCNEEKTEYFLTALRTELKSLTI
jgi:hypothetical protein